MFLKDKASFNVDWLDGYHAANEANSIPIIGSDGKLPIVIIPTGKGSTQVALGNHTHTATEVGARPSSWLPSKADIESVLVGNITSHTHNNYISSSDTSIIKGSRKKWTSVNGATTEEDSWCTLFIAEDTVAPVLVLLRGYAHTSVLFSVSTGYNHGNPIITIINANMSSANSSYRYIKGLRITESGKVQVKLNKGTNTIIDCQILDSTGSISLVATLEKDTVTTSSQVKVVIDPIVNSEMYINSNRIYHQGYKPSASDIGASPVDHTHNYAGSSSAGGSANSAVKLQTTRTINGTSFDGTANITTANWGTSRTITIGNTGKSVNGSANVSWSLSEIGALGVNDYAQGISISDTRSTNPTPVEILTKRGMRIDFKNSNVVGISDGTYVGVMSIKQWADDVNWSGGKVTQMAFGDSGNVYIRKGNNNGWDNWRTIAYTNSSITGNAATATKLQTARTINGTSFDGTSDITTANWGTSRTITIGNSSKSVNGSGNVSWTLDEIGAASSSHTHNIDVLKGTLSSTVPTSNLSPGDVKFYYNVVEDATGIFPTVSNANAILHVNRHSGGYVSQLGLSSNGNIYYRSFSGSAVDTTTAWKQLAFKEDVTNNADSWKVSMKEIPANSNLDDILEGGHYVSGSDGNSATFTNRPPGVRGFTLEVRVIWMNGGVPGRVSQVAYMRSTNEMYVRDLSETQGWSAWTRFVIDSDATSKNVASSIVRRDAYGKIAIGDLEVNGHIYMQGAGRVIITSNNYGIKGYLSDGSHDYMLYMGTDNRIKLSFNNRGIDVQGQLALKTAQGTAPMTVVSNTKVDNLNADLLDGLHSTSFLRADASNAYDVRISSSDGRGVRFWDSDSYKIYMSSATNGTWGGRMTGDTTSDYNIYFKITGNTNRGFIFKGTSGNIMGVDGNGDLRVKGSASIGDNKVKMEYNATTESLDFIFN